MVTTVISLCWKWIRFPPHRLPLRSLSHEASWCIGPSPQPVLEATKQQVLNCLLSKNHRFVEVRRFILTPTLMVYPWFILSIILPTTSGILGTPHFKSMKCKLSRLSWRTAQVNCSWHSFPPISSTQWLLHALLLKCHSYLQKENISPYVYIYIYNIIYIYIYPPLKSGVDAHSHGRHARNWGNSSCYVGQSWSVHILAPVLSLSQTCWALRLCAKGCLAALRSYEWDPMNQPISTTMLPFAFGWCMKQELCCPKM